jgi:hypothetical protein
LLSGLSDVSYESCGEEDEEIEESVFDAYKDIKD